MMKLLFYVSLLLLKFLCFLSFSCINGWISCENYAKIKKIVLYMAKANKGESNL